MAVRACACLILCDCCTALMLIFLLRRINNSFMDGLLIGLSAVAGKSAGLVMSVALTIEMTFLGLTFSAGVAKVGR